MSIPEPIAIGARFRYRHACLATALAGIALGIAVATASAADDGIRLRGATARGVEGTERALGRAEGAIRRAGGPARRGPRGETTRPAGGSNEILLSLDAGETPLLTPKPAKLRQAKAEAAEGPSGSAGPSAPTPKASVFSGLNKEGMAAEGDATPPDTTGAIGPSHYVEFVNGTGITVYDRDLDAVFGPVKLGDFIGFPADAVFDPQIQWDANWGRWIYVMDDIEEVEIGPEEFEVTNYLAFGWSKSADPSDLTTEFPGEGGEAGWCGYFIETGAEFDDYPKLGHSDAGITIGTNVFDAAGEFVGARLWSIAKPADPQSCPGFGEAGLTFAKTELPLETEDGHRAFTPVPANTADGSPNSYVVAADFPFIEETDPEIMAWHISGGGAGATLFEDGNMTVEPFEVPANVPQPFPSVEVLDSLDTRLTNAVAVTDPAVEEEGVWTQHTIDGPGGRSVVRWYELLPDTQTVRQEGAISDAEHFIFNGAISPTKLGDAAAINFNRASEALVPEMHAQSRDSGTLPDEMEGDVLLGSSGGAAQDFSCEFLVEEQPCRWGDYAGASPDPSLAALVWGSNQGLAAPLPLPPESEEARWTTRNFALVADSTIGDLTPPPAPTITATNPASPANDNSPMLIGSAEAGSTVGIHESADCSGPVVATGPAAAFGSEGVAVPVANDQTTQLSATATDLVGNTSACSAAFPYTEDSTPPPAPTITSSDPVSPANANTPKLKGSAAAGSTVRIYTSSSCSGPITVQGSAAAFASPGFGVSVPDNQTTQFTATATDGVGNTSACSAAFSYTESTPAPPPPPPPGKAQVLGKAVLMRGGKALLRMSCAGPGSCQGDLRLVARVAKQAKRARAGASAKRARNLVIGSASFSIAAGKDQLVPVPLSRKGLALLRKAGKRGLKVKLMGSGLVERALKLKPAAKKKK